MDESAYACAERLDAEDPLHSMRACFYCPPGLIYLDGNSLGLLSTAAERTLLRALEEWKQLGVAGWTDAEIPWFYLAEELAARIAPLLGAEPEEVIVANSTTVNLHQLLATLYQPTPFRPKILTDAPGFPSDLYALRSHLCLRGRNPDCDLILIPCRDGGTLHEEDIIAALEPQVQLVVLPSVVYTSGQLLDIPTLTQEAHRRGALIGFDCAHSLGVVPHQLRAWDVDFAFWCSYKYLNGGPGAAGGLYLNQKHFEKGPGLAGWFGSRKECQLGMPPEMEAAGHAGALQIGTPNILSMAPLQGALESIECAGIEAIRRKSLLLTDYLMALIDSLSADNGIRIVTPRAPGRRGGHVALAHPEAARICKALRAAGIVPDHRPPDLIRLAPVPLYNSFRDCFDAVQKLRDILENATYLNFPTGRELVP